MNRVLSIKFLAAAAFASAAVAAATVAEARPDVHLTIGIQSSPAWVAPLPGHAHRQPVFVHPGPAYAQRAPVYGRAPVFVAAHGAFDRPGWRGHDGRFESQREDAWRHAEQRRHGWREQFHGGDRDNHGRQHDHRD